MRTVDELWIVLRRHYRITIGVIAAAVAVVVVFIFLFASTTHSQEPIPYANVSSNFKVCLLTAPNGVDATIVWHAVQAATAKAPINAQQLATPTGVGTDPIPYFNSLIALHCQLVVTSGANLAAALKTTAAYNPKTHFLNIGSRVDLPNVRTIPTPMPNPTVITDDVLAEQRTAASSTH